MNIIELKKRINNGMLDDKLMDIYIDENKLSYERERYIRSLDCFSESFGDGDVKIYSAPGRSEIGGNHTDHQHGNVLAASINQDVLAIVRPTDDGSISVLSDGYDMINLNINDLAKNEEEAGTTTALVKGVLYGIQDRGYNIGGFKAYLTSDVLIGAGLSSSAAFETAIGTILSGLYNDMSISPITIAIVGQYAENVYFDKPCGLMDQMASSVGSLVQIDFLDPSNPVVNKVTFDLEAHGYSLCITDTKGSHANLTPDYAAIPSEMKAAARVCGGEVLRDVPEEVFYDKIPLIREEVNGRAVLRGIHFYEENKRAVLEAKALTDDNMDEFLQVFKSSGDSSYKYLQNVYTCADPLSQNISIALAVSEIVLKDKGVARVHGGGFAGTIQAFVKNEAVPSYIKSMNAIFGEGSCNALKIRKYGGLEVL